MSTPLFKTVHTSLAEFKCGQKSCEEHRYNQVEAITKKIISKICKIGLSDKKIRQKTDIVNISTEQVHNILHTHLL